MCRVRASASWNGKGDRHGGVAAVQEDLHATVGKGAAASLKGGGSHLLSRTSFYFLLPQMAEHDARFSGTPEPVDFPSLLICDKGLYLAGSVLHRGPALSGDTHAAFTPSRILTESGRK
jgi:hypothetical protein